MNGSNKILVSASILGADLTAVKEAVQLCERSGIDLLHIDVMDGHFVPQITFGNKFVADIKKITDMPLDVHLMVNEPGKFIDVYAEAGADSLSFHIENDIHVHRNISRIKDYKIRAGICIIPSTPVYMLSEIIEMVDYIQVMTVNPGFAGQKMIHSCIKKIRELDNIRKDKKLDFSIYVDGGVSSNTSGELIKSGANILITASAFFNSKNPALEAEAIRRGGMPL